MGKRCAGSRLLGCVLLASAWASAGCFSFQGEPFPGTVAEGAESGRGGPLGSFTVASPLLGDVTVAPTECAAGDLQQFLGADFADPGSGLVVRLVVDPLEGPAARVFDARDPFGRSVVLRRAECAAFHFSLEGTGVTINDVRDYRVSLELDCALADGTGVRGRASSTHCH